MKTTAIMQTTLIALIPGALTWCYIFGIGALVNIVVAIITALLTETIVLRIRGRNLATLRDSTAVLTGALLGLCLPPLLPVWIVVLGVAFAMIFGKHLYGGIGNNVFNPAMVGFAVLILSFPLAMTLWPAPSLSQSINEVTSAKFSLTAGQPVYDGVTAATPLDAYKFRRGETNDEFFASQSGADWQHWAWINTAFLLGGLYLMWKKVIPWQTPVALLSTLFLLSAMFFDGGSSGSLGSPLFHLFTGATMLAAFFIVTDPVTCPGYKQGLILFGIGVGVITFIIRTQGAYPEGIAFGVLLMNAASPLIDHAFAVRDEVPT